MGINKVLGKPKTPSIPFIYYPIYTQPLYISRFLGLNMIVSMARESSADLLFISSGVSDDGKLSNFALEIKNKNNHDRERENAGWAPLLCC